MIRSMMFERDRVAALLREAYHYAEDKGKIPPHAAQSDATCASLMSAAVLVPLIMHAEGVTVLLTERAKHLSHHPGQVAFPGGVLDTNDQDSIACALRELEEEVGISASQVDVLGLLIPYHTLTGFCMTPVVGIITPPIHIQSDPCEVADTFEVPLDFICQMTHRREIRATVGGIPRSFYEMVWDGHRIWGATAAILVNLSCVLAGKDAYSDLCYGDRA